MIGRMRTLLRIKNLKLDQALGVMQAKRQEVAMAQAARAAAKARLDESARTYARREDAVYAPILRRVVDHDGIEATRGRVVQLEKEHAALGDVHERARHVLARLEVELETATKAYFAALRVRDKFVLMIDEMLAEAARTTESREEAEIEELFVRPRRKAA